MEKDEKVVQEEPVSDKEPVSGEEPKAEVKEEPKEEPKEQPLSKEQEARVQQLVAEETVKAVTEAKEAGRRQLQGEQDRNRNVERRARLAESRVNAYETSFKGLDEDTQKDIELERYREENKQYQSTAQEETQRQKEAAYYQQMNDSLTEEVKSWGIEPSDKRIDYASDAPDYFTGRKRFSDSLQKIIKADAQKEMDDLREDVKKQNLKNRKDLGLDSVDTTAGGGGGSDSDKEFKKGLGDGSIPLNKETMARAKKLGLA